MFGSDIRNGNNGVSDNCEGIRQTYSFCDHFCSGSPDQGDSGHSQPLMETPKPPETLPKELHYNFTYVFHLDSPFIVISRIAKEKGYRFVEESADLRQYGGVKQKKQSQWLRRMRRQVKSPICCSVISLYHSGS